MKKFSAILLCVVMIAAMLPAAANAAVDETYVRSGDNGDVTVVYVKDAAVTIDGNITDKEWSAATKIPLNGTTTMKTWGLGVFSGTMDFRTAWGENGLYVSAVIYDDRIADGAANEGSLSTRFQIALNPAGIICDPWSGLFFSFTPVAGSSDVALMKHFWESSSDNGTWVKAEEGYTGKYTLIKSGDKTVGWNLEAVIPWALISTADRQTDLDENDETPLTTFSPKAEDRSKAFCNAMICYVQCSTRDGNVISTARTCKNGNPDAWEAGSYDINLKFDYEKTNDDIIKSAKLVLGAEFLPGEINNAIEMRGFTASPDGKSVYGGFLQGGRYVVRYNVSDGAITGEYKPGSSDNELYCKGLAMDDRGYLYVGITHRNHNDVSVAVLNSEMEQIGYYTENLSGSSCGINGVAVQKLNGKYYLYAVTAYDVDTVRCYDVTDAANISLNADFGDNGVMDYAAVTGGQGDPSYIAVDKDGYVYLTYLKSGSGKGSHVAKIDKTGKNVLKEAAVTQAYGICEAGDYLFVSTYNKANSCVVALNKKDLSTVATLKYENQGNDLSDIAYGGDTLFVGDHGNKSTIAGAYYKAGIKLKKNVVPGDINKDGSANNKDVVALFRYVSSGKGNVDELACDCNGDGHKNNKDVVTLFRYVSSGKVTIYYNGAPVLPDKQLTYTSAKIYADEETANKNGCETPTRTDLANWFIGQANFDEVTFEIIIPEEMAYLESYVVRSAIGKYIEEVNVLKVNDPTKLDAVKAMVEGHAKRQNDNQDYSLYNDDGRNGKMIGTGKVAVYGNFVVYACTLDSSLSVLRAQKYVAENPDATAFDVYRAVVCELYE